jgi:hypothetical protein
MDLKSITKSRPREAEVAPGEWRSEQLVQNESQHEEMVVRTVA